MLWGIEQHSHSIIAIVEKNVFMVTYMVTLKVLPDGGRCQLHHKVMSIFQKVMIQNTSPFSLFFLFFFWYVHKEYNSYSQNNDGLIDTLLGPKGPTSMDDSVEFLRAWMFGSHWKPHGFIFFFFSNLFTSVYEWEKTKALVCGSRWAKSLLLLLWQTGTEVKIPENKIIGFDRKLKWNVEI